MPDDPAYILISPSKEFKTNTPLLYLLISASEPIVTLKNATININPHEKSYNSDKVERHCELNIVIQCHSEECKNCAEDTHRRVVHSQG